MKFNPTTPLLFYWQSSDYVPGEGQSVTWVQVIPQALFAEWRGGFGERALSAQAVGVEDMATVRTFYHPKICDKLQRTRVMVVKNGDKSAVIDGIADVTNPNLYELWGGVDDALEARQYMEFRVRRYEAK